MMYEMYTVQSSTVQCNKVLKRIFLVNIIISIKKATEFIIKFVYTVQDLGTRCTFQSQYHKLHVI